MKLYLVNGESPHAALDNLTAHFVATDADAQALRLVNMIRQDAPRDGDESDEATPSLEPLPDGADWRKGLVEAQRCLASFMLKLPLLVVTGEPVQLVRITGVNVVLVELDVEGVPSLPAALESLLEKAQAVADLLEEALPVHIYDNDEPEKNVYRDALADLSAVMQIARWSAVTTAARNPGIIAAPLSEDDLARLQGFAGGARFVSQREAVQIAANAGFTDLYEESENGDNGPGSRLYYALPKPRAENQFGFPSSHAVLDRWGEGEFCWTVHINREPGSACDDPERMHALDNARYPDDRPEHDLGQGSHEQSFGGEKGGEE